MQQAVLYVADTCVSCYPEVASFPCLQSRCSWALWNGPENAHNGSLRAWNSKLGLDAKQLLGLTGQHRTGPRHQHQYHHLISPSEQSPLGLALWGLYYLLQLPPLSQGLPAVGLVPVVRWVHSLGCQFLQRRTHLLPLFQG